MTAVWLAAGGVAVLVLAAGAMYWFAPGAVYALAMAGERARAGLRREVVRAGGHDIALLRSRGDRGTAGTVVMLHGFGADAYHWPRLVHALRRSGGPPWRVVAPDLPGFGESSRDPDADYGAPAQIARLHALFDRLGLKRFHLVGSSMGGHLAATYLRTHPGRVLSLTLIDAAGVTPQARTPFNTALDEGRNLLLTTSRDDFRRVTALVFHHAPFVPGRVLDHLGERSAASRDWYARLFDDYLKRYVPLEQGPPLPAVPALVIWGEEDQVLPVEDTAVFARLLPHARVAVLEDTGHLPMLERPRRVAALCRTLFAEARDAPP